MNERERRETEEGNEGKMSTEIVEVEEESKSINRSIEEGLKDVYVAVGKGDLNVLRWTLEHAVEPGGRVFLVHVFAPITYISSPVGKLSRSQLSQEQVRVYMNEESNRRRNLLQRYIQLCTDANVAVDTILIESKQTGKAILDLISVLHITKLVMGTKRPRFSRRLRKGFGKGEFVQKQAPDSCEVNIVFDGRKVEDGQKLREVVSAKVSDHQRREIISSHSEKNLFECVCFSAKSN